MQHAARDMPAVPNKAMCARVLLFTRYVADTDVIPHTLSLRTQEELISFVEDAIARSGAGILPGNAISFCRIQPEKNFAFIEVRSAEEATNCLALDGVCLRGEIALKVCGCC